MDDYEQAIELLISVSDNPGRTAYELGALGSDPVADERILPHLKKLCNDTRIMQYGIPPFYSEVRYIAGYALQAHYAILGIGETVHLPALLKPMTNKQISRAYEEAGGFPRSGMTGVESYELLVEMGKVSTHDYEFPPTKIVKLSGELDQ